MIRFIRSAQAMPGKGAEVVELGQRVTEYLRTKHGMTINFGHEVGGDVGRFYWVSEHENMAALEAAMIATETDAELDALIKEGADYYLPGHTQDRIVRFF